MTPDLKIVHSGPVVELAAPISAADAFNFLAIRAAEQFVTTKAPEWAMISEVLKKMADFCGPVDFASARHVKWAYQVILKRIPEAQGETGPLVAWMNRIPALATDKAAAAPLLWHYLASCAGQYAAGLPRVQGSPGAWTYQRGGLAITCSNEEAYAINQQRHYWSEYQPRLLYVLGVLLREMAGVPERERPVVVPAAVVDLQPVQAAEPAAEPDSAQDLAAGAAVVNLDIEPAPASS